MRRLPRLTSPYAISLVALVLALTSPAWGDPVVHTAASVGSKAKKALGLSKKANKRSKKALKTANAAKDAADLALAKGGPPGPKGATGAPGSALAFARVLNAAVDGTDTVDETKSKGVADANVTHPTTGDYCFYNLPFTPKNAVATPDFFPAVTLGVTLGDTSACPGTADVVVGARSGPVTAVDTGFYILFN
jgi:hypothetical protein